MTSAVFQIWEGAIFTSNGRANRKESRRAPKHDGYLDARAQRATKRMMIVLYYSSNGKMARMTLKSNSTADCDGVEK
jgi:hypothetical protein